MTIAVFSDEALKEELIRKSIPDTVSIIWADSVRSLTIIEADIYMDLLFEMDNERTEKLIQMLPKPVFVNSVPYTIAAIGKPFVRINAWPTMLQRDIVEVAVYSHSDTESLANIFKNLKWNYQLVPDICGMITPRILAMIVNEAYYALEDKVSTKEEIDTAMKLGTNYPMGPFEWSEKIGLVRIYELLKELSRTDSRYTAAPALIKEL